MRDFAGQKIKPLRWVKDLSFGAFSDVDYPSMIVQSKTVVGNRDYRPHPADERTEAQRRGLG